MFISREAAAEPAKRSGISVKKKFRGRPAGRPTVQKKSHVVTIDFASFFGDPSVQQKMHLITIDFASFFGYPILPHFSLRKCDFLLVALRKCDYFTA